MLREPTQKEEVNVAGSKQMLGCQWLHFDPRTQKTRERDPEEGRIRDRH